MSEQSLQETGDTYAFAPILNFRCDASELRLTQGIMIRSPSSEEKQVIEKFADFHAPKAWGKWNLVACSATYRKRGDMHSVSFKCVRELFNLCGALRLFKRGPVGLGAQFQMDKTTMVCLLHGSSEVVSGAYGQKYSLLSAEFPDFESFHGKYCQFDFSGNRRVQTAIFRFGVSYEVGLMYKPIDLMIAFEALYLAEEQELSYKIATRAAYLLGDTAERRRFIYSLLRNAYTIRSKLVHGGDIPREVKIAGSHSLEISEFVFEVEDILRESIKKFMDLLARYSHNQLLATLLDDNVLASGALL